MSGVFGAAAAMIRDNRHCLQISATVIFQMTLGDAYVHVQLKVLQRICRLFCLKWNVAALQNPKGDVRVCRS
ncbi:MAG: hypothetical protein ACKPHU_06405, partial [Planctomycetaceae bacterium]